MAAVGLQAKSAADNEIVHCLLYIFEANGGHFFFEGALGSSQVSEP